MEKNGMETAALVLGILSVITCFCCGIGFVFGGLGILFACLSRTDKMSTNARTGLTTSILGVIFSILIMAASLFLALESSDLPELLEKYDHDFYIQEDTKDNWYDYDDNTYEDPYDNGENDSSTDIYDRFQDFFKEMPDYNGKEYYKNGGRKL